jgi:hypothetical protein
MGQVFAAIELLHRFLDCSATACTIDEPEDSDPVLVVEILGSLLSNVTSSDQTRPIVPLHTLFRDFLTNKMAVCSMWTLPMPIIS